MVQTYHTTRHTHDTTPPTPHLTVTTTSGPSLDTKGGPLTGLPHTRDYFFIQVCTQCLTQAHCGGALALSKGGWGDASNNNCVCLGLGWGGTWCVGCGGCVWWGNTCNKCVYSVAL